LEDTLPRPTAPSTALPPAQTQTQTQKQGARRRARSVSADAETRNHARRIVAHARAW
jgi:hypothetical protein